MRPLLVKRLTFGFSILLWIFVTAFFSYLLPRVVDLKPKVEQDFFFAENDPQLEADRRIKEIFAEPEQLVISIKGRILSEEYLELLGEMTEEIKALEGILGVQSLTEGPVKPEQGIESELWKRVLISEADELSNILIFLEEVPYEDLIPKIEAINEKYNRPGFSIKMAGAPYVIELIRQNLVRDLQIFSLAALLTFSVMMLIIFRSWIILAGTVVACLNASIATLFAAHFSKISLGPLTANLSTIVFVLTLSHIAYITFNWKHLLESHKTAYRQLGPAVRMTLAPSFWSMLTTFLGFLSLIFVQAAPLRRLGVTGALGTLIAFFVAYLVYPFFLAYLGALPGTKKRLRKKAHKIPGFLVGSNKIFALLAVVVVGFIATGVKSINSDPSLLLYFKKGGIIRDNLEFVDRNGGSSSFKIVISNEDGTAFDNKKSYERMWAMQKELEDYYPIGRLISIPLFMHEAKERIPFSYFFRWKKVIDILESPLGGEVIRFFLSESRKMTLVIMLMHESFKVEPRQVIINKVLDIIKSHGFKVEIVGGMYLLQGQLAELVVGSLFMGLGLLLFLFVVMGLFLSRSLQITFALFVSLLLIPAWLLGVIGRLNFPLDIISAPAANIAIAMGVDAMVHMIIAVRHYQKSGVRSDYAWVEAKARLWRPILSSVLIVCSGFLIFGLSNFPPTQRFGLNIVIGTLMAPVAAILVLPALGARTVRIKDKSEHS